MLQIFQTNALGVAVPQMGIAKIEIKKLTNRAGVKSNGQITHYAPIKDVLAGKKSVSKEDQADMPYLEFDKDGFVKPDNVKQVQQIHKQEARAKQFYQKGIHDPEKELKTVPSYMYAERTKELKQQLKADPENKKLQEQLRDRDIAKEVQYTSELTGIPVNEIKAYIGNYGKTDELRSEIMRTSNEYNALRAQFNEAKAQGKDVSKINQKAKELEDHQDKLTALSGTVNGLNATYFPQPKAWDEHYKITVNDKRSPIYLHTWKELAKHDPYYKIADRDYKALQKKYGADLDNVIKEMIANGGQAAGYSEMGDVEFHESFRVNHKQAIAEALKRGVDVPKAVLKEYPEFATIKPKQEPKVKADTSTAKPIDNTNATYTKLIGGTGGTIEFPDKNRVSLIIGTDGRTPKGDDIYSTFVNINNGDIVAKIPANQYARDLYTKAIITSLAESVKNVKNKEELQTLLTKFDDGLIQKQRDKYGKISGKVVDYVDATKGIVEAEIPLSPYKLVPLNQVPRKTIQGKQYGDFIAHKEGNDYQITHIPSGLKITTGDKATIDKQAQSLANSEVAKFIPKNLGRIMFGLDLSGYAITPSEFNAAMRKALKV